MRERVEKLQSCGALVGYDVGADLAWPVRSGCGYNCVRETRRALSEPPSLRQRPGT